MNVLDRPILLHVRSSPADSQFQAMRMLLLCTLRSPKIDGVKCYDGLDCEIFADLLSQAENASSLTVLPSMTGQVVIAEFPESRLVAYENIARYLEVYTVSAMCTNPNCKEDHSKPKAEPVDASPKPEEYEKHRQSHEDGCKKIVENYINRVNFRLVYSGLVETYNRIQKVPLGGGVPDDLRQEAHNYVKLTYYKCSLVPLRNREDMGKVASTMAVFDEAETDDTRSMMAQAAAPSSVLLSMSRVQRRARDREYVLHCLAFFAGLKFDNDEGIDGPHGRGSMYM